MALTNSHNCGTGFDMRAIRTGRTSREACSDARDAIVAQRRWAMSSRRWTLPVCIAMLFLLLPVPPILPATSVGAASAIIVQNANDSGPGSLRQAIADIDPGGTITFAQGVGTITLAAILDVTKSLTITGNGPSATIVQMSATPFPTDDQFAFFFHPPNATETFRISALTVRNSGVGIVNQGQATLVATNVALNGNVVGMAAQSNGPTTLAQSLVANTDQMGIFAIGPTTIVNTTVTGSLIGIDVEGNSVTTVTNATIANNGTGVNLVRGLGVSLALTNTIVANNTTSNCRAETGAAITDGGHNLEYGTGAPASSCPFTAAAIHADPQLGPLQDNGGPTPTRALGANSPAINAGGTIGTDCPATDQRGGTRTAQCDIGAFERVLLPSTTALTRSPNPSVFGQSVTFTATVTIPLGGTPTGSVAFKDNGTDVTGCTSQSLSGGVATCTTSSLGAGDHPITATYSGDSNFATSASSAVTQTVNQALTTTTLASSVNPSTFAQSVTFTATVGVTPPGGGTPSGSVTFKDNGTNLTGCVSRPLSGGSATCITSSLGVGDHPITATYSGDGNFAGSTSTALVQHVIVTEASIDALIDAWVTDPGPRTGLKAQVHSIATAQNGAQQAALVQAFTNHVQGLVPQDISQANADTLVASVNALAALPALAPAPRGAPVSGATGGASLGAGTSGAAPNPVPAPRP